jgi:ribosomal protein L27
MQINFASLAAGLKKEIDEMNQKVDIISKQKGTMHQVEENVGKPRGHPA